MKEDKQILKEKRTLSLLLTLILFLIISLIPVYSRPVAYILADNQINALENLPYVRWTAKITINLESYDLLSGFNFTKICLITTSGKIFCAKEFSVSWGSTFSGYGYYYVPNWEQHSFYSRGYGYFTGFKNTALTVSATFTFSTPSIIPPDNKITYTFSKVRFMKNENEYIDINLDKPFTLTINFVSTALPVPPSGFGGIVVPPSSSSSEVREIVNKEHLSKALEKLGIKVDNISKIEITRTKNLRPRDITGEEKEKIENKLQNIIKKKVTVGKAQVKQYNCTLVKLTLKDGRVVYLTKVSKIVEDKKVIEYIPKSVVEKANDIIWINGSYKIIEEDPIFEVVPENSLISYVVYGNKLDSSSDFITLTYSEVNEEEQPSQPTQPSQPSEETSESTETTEGTSGGATIGGGGVVGGGGGGGVSTTGNIQVGSSLVSVLVFVGILIGLILAFSRKK